MAGKVLLWMHLGQAALQQRRLDRVPGAEEMREMEKLNYVEQLCHSAAGLCDTDATQK